MCVALNLSTWQVQQAVYLLWSGLSVWLYIASHRHSNSNSSSNSPDTFTVPDLAFRWLSAHSTVPCDGLCWRGSLGQPGHHAPAAAWGEVPDCAHGILNRPRQHLEALCQRWVPHTVVVVLLLGETLSATVSLSNSVIRRSATRSVACMCESRATSCPKGR